MKYFLLRIFLIFGTWKWALPPETSRKNTSEFIKNKVKLTKKYSMKYRRLKPDTYIRNVYRKPPFPINNDFGKFPFGNAQQIHLWNVFLLFNKQHNPFKQFNNDNKPASYTSKTTKNYRSISIYFQLQTIFIESAVEKAISELWRCRFFTASKVER